MQQKTTTEEPAKATRGSGNVFADIGLEDSDELLAKAELVRYINAAIEKRGLSQQQVAEQLGIHQPQVSLIRRGALGNFSLERLLQFVVLLGGRVDIRIGVKSARKVPAFKVSIGGEQK